MQLGPWDGVPLEIEAPVEASPDQRTGGVVEGVGVDDVNYGRDHVSPGTPYTVQQGLQPIDIDHTYVRAQSPLLDQVIIVYFLRMGKEKGIIK